MKEKGNPAVSKKQLDALIKNYQGKVKRVRKGNSAVHNHDPKIDSKSIWFSRAAIEELFNANEADGLRIYFCVHDKDIMDTLFDDQLTAVLVATKNVGGRNVDQLFEQEEVQQEATVAKAAATKPVGKGSGLNHGLICPPNNCP